MFKSKIIIKKKFDTELKEKWYQLEKESQISFFQTYDWQEYWYNICGVNLDLYIILFYKNEELVSILPLNIKKSFLKILNWNGFPFSDYNQPILKTNYHLKLNDFKFIISQLREIVKFDNIHFINNINPHYLDDTIKINNISYQLMFTRNEQQHNIIQKLKNKIKYEYRKLKINYNLEINLNPTKHEKKNILNFFITQKTKQLNRTNAWNYLNIKKYKNYINNLLDYNNKNITFSCLKIENKIISAHIGYVYNNIFYYIFPVYDNDYKKYSPGNILLCELLENCQTENFKSFDFTIGSEAYKTKLNNKSCEIIEYISSETILGYTYSFLIKLKIFLKKLIKKKIF